MVAMFFSGSASVSSQAIRLRGVIRLSAVRSPRRMTRFIMSRSWASITPASWLSATSMRISSSVTEADSSLPRPSTRNTSRVEWDSSQTPGAAIFASQLMGSATRPAMSSERVRASRLGTSSPKISVRKVIRATARVLPTTPEYANAGNMPCSHSAMVRPIASPPNRPVRMPIRVIPIWTVDRKFSGFSESARARSARLLEPAICFSRLLREVMTDISDMAKKPFSRIRARTIISSNTGGFPGWWQGGRVQAMSATGGRVSAAVRRGVRVVVHRVHPKVPAHLNKRPGQGCKQSRSDGAVPV